MRRRLAARRGRAQRSSAIRAPRPQSVFGEGNGLGNYWYLSTLVSPVAGKYYLDNAERTDQVTVKIVTEDDEMSSDIVVQGDEEEVTRFQKTLDLREKGMVYVKGILES